AAVERHHAADRIVEPQEEVEDRRFARSARAAEGDGFARFDLDGDVPQYRSMAVPAMSGHGRDAHATLVAERHVAQLHLAADAIDLDGVGRVGQLVGRVEYLEDPPP